MKWRFALILTIAMGLAGCGKPSIPRPYGYHRISCPDTAYHCLQNGPYSFDMSDNAEAQDHSEPGSAYWLDLYYPSLDATIYCSYEPVHNNLAALTADALEFVYKHAGQATSIPEREFVNEDKHVYGLFFTLKGNTASPYQFFVTDSIHHFFRASVYCNCRPNADSLQPVFEYLEKDMERMVETMRWN